MLYFRKVGDNIYNLLKKNKDYLLIFLFLLIPIISMISNLFGVEYYIVLYLPNIVMLVYGIKKLFDNRYNIFTPLNLLLFIFILCSLLSCIFAYNITIAIFGNGYRIEGLVTYISYFGFFYCGTRIKEEKYSKFLLKTFVIIACIVSLLTIAQFDISYKLFNIDKVNSYYTYKAIFPHFNHFGYYLLVANLCSLYLFFNENKYKIVYFLLNLILLYTMLCNDTLGVLLSYIFGLIIMLIKYLKYDHKIRESICTIISIIVVSILTTNYFNENIVKKNFDEFIHDSKIVTKSSNNENSNSDISDVGTGRVQLWKYAIKYIIKRPILGYGFDNISLLYSNDNIIQSKPHNHILDLCVSIGVIGTIIYILLIILIIIKGIKKKSDKNFLPLVIVISFLLNLMVGNSTYYISPYFYIFLGILVQTSNTKENN